MYTNNKTLKGDANKGYIMNIDLDGWKSWGVSTLPDLAAEAGEAALAAME